MVESQNDSSVAGHSSNFTKGLWPLYNSTSWVQLGGGNFLSPFSSFSLTTGRKKQDIPFSGQEGDFCYARAITAYELVPHQRPEQDEQRGWELAGKILGPL